MIPQSDSFPITAHPEVIYSSYTTEICQHEQVIIIKEQHILHFIHLFLFVMLETSYMNNNANYGEGALWLSG